MKNDPMPTKRLSQSLSLLLFLSSLFMANTALSTIIDSSATGLAAPTNTIDFSEVALVNGATVTNQYAGLGVSFSPQITYLSSVSARPNFAGSTLVNFGGDPFTVYNPFSLLFSTNVNAATFAFTKNSGSTQFESLLNGAVVETFTSVTSPAGPTSPATNFYGFQNSLFDEIRVTQVSGSGTAALDSLSFASAPVPDSGSSAILIVLGLATCGFFRRFIRR